jgi:hypothetical protein
MEAAPPYSLVLQVLDRLGQRGWMDNAPPSRSPRAAAAAAAASERAPRPDPPPPPPQVCAQHKAFRLVQHFNDEVARQKPCLFPPSFAEEVSGGGPGCVFPPHPPPSAPRAPTLGMRPPPQAVELGPHANTKGPCLVMFKAVRLTKAQVMAWFEGCVIIRRQSVRLYWLDHMLPPSTSQ